MNMRLSRNHQKRTARGLLAVVAGLWLLAAAAPCIAAQTQVCPPDTLNGHCPADHAPALAASDNCDALAALNCRLPNPNPPSAAPEIPAPAPLLLQTLPLVPDVTRAPRAPNFVRAAADPPTPVLNRKQSRLLI